AERRHHGEERDEEQRRRYQISDDEPPRDQRSSGETQAGQGVGAQASERERQQRVADGDDRAVAHVLQERRRAEQAPVGGERGPMRIERRLEAVDLAVGLERSRDATRERQGGQQELAPRAAGGERVS